MRYENPKLPEHINLPPRHPFKESLRLCLVVIGGLVSFWTLLMLTTPWLVTLISFDTERQWVDDLDKNFLNIQHSAPTSEHGKIQRYLQYLADEIVATSATDPSMAVTVHYVEQDVINAFATLGGHVIIYRGLLENLPSENALTLLLAHEIAHVQHRDPIIALGRMTALVLSGGAISGFGSNAISQRILNHMGLLSSLRFNRNQELRADEVALNVVYQQYGTLSGAWALFTQLQCHSTATPPAFLSTHPALTERIARATALAHSTPARTTPLPDFIPQDTTNRPPCTP